MFANAVRAVPGNSPLPQGQASRHASVSRSGTRGVMRRCGGVPCNCSGPEEETRLKGTIRRTHSTSGSARDGGSVPKAVTEALASPGRSLTGVVRRRMEGFFGHPLGHVRIHEGPLAAGAATSVNARAFAVGRDIVFGHNEFQPATSAGQRLLAHELTHVLQQDGDHAASASLAIGSIRDPTESEAEANARVYEDAGDRFVGTGPHPGTSAMPGTPTVRRFASGEHVRIGGLAEPGVTVPIFGYGRVSFGELIAMAGDYFESLDQMQDLASGRLGVPASDGQKQIECTRYKVNHDGGACPTSLVPQYIDDAVETRYRDLAARNETHFTTGSAPGRSNRDVYIQLHQRAVRSAWAAGAFPVSPQPFWYETLEASADHFLTDAFSGGHIRTPRGELRSYWNGMYPGFTDNLIRLISCYMAAYLRDVENISAPVSWIAFGQWPVTNGIEPEVRSRAGTLLGSYGIGDVISLAMHDADNAGLDVVSARGPAGAGSPTPYRWRAVGDVKLFPSGGTTATTAQQQTLDMLLEAVRTSFSELSAAEHAGRSSKPPADTPADFHALALLPAADPASTTNPAYVWRVANIRALPALMRGIIAAEFRPSGGLHGKLTSFSLRPCIDGHHVQCAWQCFSGLLLADPFEMIARACEANVCPAGNNNPCTGSGNPCPTLPAC